jgi:HK97 gp10 family phage protein
MKIEGLKELEAKLVELGKKTGTKLIVKAGRKAMKPVLADAKEGANEDSGDLKRSMAISSTKKRKGNRAVSVDVGPTRRQITEKAENGERTKRKLNMSLNTQKSLAQEYGNREGTEGGGQKAEPFLRPALDKNATTVLTIFKEELAKEIEKVAQ